MFGPERRGAPTIFRLQSMLRNRRFKPTFWATFFTVPAVLFMLGLSWWQIERLQWKTALIAQFEERVNQPAVLPPDRIDDVEEWRYRRVRLVGTYLHDKEVLITGKPFEGNPGFHLITPMRLADGRTVLVNRGWIALKAKGPEDTSSMHVEGLQTLEGLIREDGLRGSFVPDNEPAKEVWLYVDTAEIAAYRGLGPLLPYYVDRLREPGQNKTPIGATTKISVRNEHLSYAATWALLAATLIVIYVLYHLRPVEEDGEARR